VAVVRDISERKQAEDALAFQAEILRQVSDAIVVTKKDAANTITYWNQGAEKIYGWTADEVIGKSSRFLNTQFYGQDGDVILAKITSSGYFEGEVTQQKKDGTQFSVDTRLISLRNNQDEISSWIAVNRDITKRKQSEEELRRHRDQLEELVAERTLSLEKIQEQLVRQERLAVLGQLAGGVGHELRNPLGVITNAIYYLKTVQPDVDEKIAEYLDLIENNAQDANRIISDLLDFARVKTADPSPVTVGELVRMVIERHSHPDDIQIEADIPAKLPNVVVDPNQIKQVITNLVTNAYHAMPTGGQLSIVAQEIAGGGVSIAIADTGTGIAPENLAKIFEPLYTTKAKGIGLGLAISKMLVEVNGGHIEFESQVGEGSVFTISLPTD
jgi:PAS domain S-box-containing protein